MVRLVVGEKGTGKTKRMIEMANDLADTAHGSIIFVDKNRKSMYNLKYSIRLVSLEEYPVKDTKSFIGFLCGMLASDHDIETIFIDRLLSLTDLELEGLTAMIEEIERLGEIHDVEFIVSVSCAESELPEALKQYETL